MALKNILILGSKGMAGHMIRDYLAKKESLIIVSFNRPNFSINETNNWMTQIIDENNKEKIDYIINCIGVLVKKSEENPTNAILINSLFPHKLANLCSKLDINLIHLSTDCWNDASTYGRSKRAGEINYPNHLTIRTSIIGPELKNGTGLFDWFMKEQEVNGFSEHYWVGITTLELSKIIYEIIMRDNKLKGIVDLRSREKVSKYELLKKINHIFNRKIEINKKETEIIDKTNNNPNILSNLSLNEQIIELKLWMQEHRKNYEKYKI